MRMSIPELIQKIKHPSGDTVHMFYVIGIMVMVGLASFALGRLSVIEQDGKATVSYPEEVVRRAERSVSENTTIVASRRGTRYYYSWCSGAENLSPANLIEFESVEDARRAGYTPATNCDGLE